MWRSLIGGAHVGNIFISPCLELESESDSTAFIPQPERFRANRVTFTVA